MDAEGKLDAEFKAFLNRATGIEQGAVDGQSAFQIGSTSVTPTAETRTYPTAEGGVIGPASFQLAYHGTPHKVDKFTLDKIGTGEGAQAYGWGLYFAQDKAVADSYRDALSSQEMKYLVDGVEIERPDTSTPDGWIIQSIAQNGDNGARKSLDSFREEYGDNNSFLVDALESFEKYKGRVSWERKATGQLYTVDFAPTDYQLFDWDAAPERAKRVRASRFYVARRLGRYGSK